MVKNPPANAGDERDVCSTPGSARSPSRKWQPTPVLLPEKFHGQRSLVGYSPWGHKEWDTTEQAHMKTVDPKHNCPQSINSSSTGHLKRFTE